MTRRDADNRDADDRDADNRDVDAVDSAAATGHGARLSTRRRGLVNRLAVFPANGVHVLGLSSNGLLSVISLVVRRRADRRGGGAPISAAAGRVHGDRDGRGRVWAVRNGERAGSRHTADVLACGMSNVILSMLATAGAVVAGRLRALHRRLAVSNPYQLGAP